MKPSMRPKTIPAWISNLDERLRAIENKRRIRIAGYVLEGEDDNLTLRHVSSGETTTIAPAQVTQTYLEAGTNVTVTGTGTADDPYVVTSTGGGGSIGVSLDTVIKQGPAGVATNTVPSGVRVPQDFTTTGWYLRCNVNHMPSGGPCTAVVKDMATGTTLATVTIAAGASSGFVVTPVALTAGQILRYDLTAVGATNPAWDIAVTIVGT